MTPHLLCIVLCIVPSPNQHLIDESNLPVHSGIDSLERRWNQLGLLDLDSFGRYWKQCHYCLAIVWHLGWLSCAGRRVAASNACKGAESVRTKNKGQANNVKIPVDS